MTNGILYGQFDKDLIPYQTREKVFVLSEDGVRPAIWISGNS